MSRETPTLGHQSGNSCEPDGELPAGFEPLELLDEEALQDLGTLEEGRVVGVVVAAVVEHFGHVRHKLCQLAVVTELQPALHGGQVWGTI